jgi:predicted 3-demethylubiquinone-9 3-methyltransferase (glyoxalase superfamily)
MLGCDDQAELDRYWSAPVEGGGAYDNCGWLRDRFGVSWQIVPNDFIAMMGDPDAEKAGRVAKAMMQMNKFDVAALRAAYEGTGG